MRRFVRAVTRLLLLTAVVGGVIRFRRSIMGRTADAPVGGAVRIGSFDSWPAVPVAPGRHHPTD